MLHVTGYLSCPNVMSLTRKRKNTNQKTTFNNNTNILCKLYVNNTHKSSAANVGNKGHILGQWFSTFSGCHPQNNRSLDISTFHCFHSMSKTWIYFTYLLNLNYSYSLSKWKVMSTSIYFLNYSKVRVKVEHLKITLKVQILKKTTLE